MRDTLNIINNLPGEGRSNLLLVVGDLIPAGVYTERVEAKAGTMYERDRALFGRLERLGLDLYLIAGETETAPSIGFGGLHMLTDGPAEARHTGTTDIRVALAKDHDVQARYIKASLEGNYKELARLQGVPDDSIQHRDRRGYERDWDEFVRTGEIPDCVAFSPFKPTLVRGQSGLYIPEGELELYVVWSEAIKTLSARVYRETLEAFKGKISREPTPV